MKYFPLFLFVLALLFSLTIYRQTYGIIKLYERDGWHCSLWQEPDHDCVTWTKVTKIRNLEGEK